MSLPKVRFTPSAAADIEHAAQWYDAERAGLGAEFQAELWRLLDLLVTMPQMGPIAHHDRIVGEVLEIRAFLHHRKDRTVRLRRP